MEYGPAYTPPAPADSASVETEAGAGATAVTPVSPVRFYWAGEEITGGRLKIRAGAEELTLRITCPAGPTSIKLDRPGKKVWEDEIVVDPPLILRIGPVPAGESRLTIGTSAGTFELSIQGGDG